MGPCGIAIDIVSSSNLWCTRNVLQIHLFQAKTQTHSKYINNLQNRTFDTDLQQMHMCLNPRVDLEQLRRIVINRTRWCVLHKTIQEKQCKTLSGHRSSHSHKLAATTEEGTYNSNYNNNNVEYLGCNAVT